MESLALKEVHNYSTALLEQAKATERIGNARVIDEPLAKYVQPNKSSLEAFNARAAQNTDRLAKATSGARETAETVTGAGNEALRESEAVSGCPLEGHGGHWEGERGNSKWIPDKNDVPKNPKTNPEGMTWGEIRNKYGINDVPFKDGEPDFSEVSKGTVEIDKFTENRLGKGGNFDQASEKLAQERGCTKEEVKAWMKENKYTWHERSDCRTIDKVPTEVHGNVRHEGGIAEINKR